MVKQYNLKSMHKGLDITFTNNLLQSEHCKIIASKSLPYSGTFLRQTKRNATIYISLVRSQILSCSIALSLEDHD